MRWASQLESSSVESSAECAPLLLLLTTTMVAVASSQVTLEQVTLEALAAM
jgi:hypothetical protein